MGTVGHPLTCAEPCMEAWQPGRATFHRSTEAPLNTKALALNAPSCSGDSFACPECASRSRCDRWLQQGYCLPAPWWQLEMWLSKAFEVYDAYQQFWKQYCSYTVAEIRLHACDVDSLSVTQYTVGSRSMLCATTSCTARLSHGDRAIGVTAWRRGKSDQGG